MVHRDVMSGSQRSLGRRAFAVVDSDEQGPLVEGDRRQRQVAEVTCSSQFVKHPVIELVIGDLRQHGHGVSEDFGGFGRLAGVHRTDRQHTERLGMLSQAIGASSSVGDEADDQFCFVVVAQLGQALCLAHQQPQAGGGVVGAVGGALVEFGRLGEHPERPGRIGFVTQQCEVIATL